VRLDAARMGAMQRPALAKSPPADRLRGQAEIRMRGSTSFLYVITVLIWGTSWYAMEYQLVIPFELAILYRFALATAMLVGYCLITGRSLRFSGRDHLFMSAQGFFLFGINYVLFYWAADYLISALLAVCFSTLIVMNLVNGAIFFRTPITARAVIAAFLGIGGIALIFWPEIAQSEISTDAMIGLALSMVGTYSASLGNMVTVRHKDAKIPVVESNAIGMAYGTLFVLLLVLVRGIPITFATDAGYLISLFYLALFASVIGFGSYLTILQRLGADKAAYTSVLFPVVALAVSTWLEGFVWTWLAIIGLLLVISGNLLVLMRLPRRAQPLPGKPALDETTA
jgi:drug/metabolite transporter (DMT)-like permease